MIGRLTRRMHGNDEGFTLAELMVVMGLMAVIGALIGTTMVAGIRTSGDVSRIVTSTESGDTALDAMSRYLRAGTNQIDPSGLTDPIQGFLTTTSTEASFYSNVRNTDTTSTVYNLLGPTLVDFKIVPDPKSSSVYELVQTTTAASGTAYPYTYETTPGSTADPYGYFTKVLATGLANPSTAGVTAPFTYYQPRYYTVGSSSGTGQANCNATTAVAPVVASTGGGAAYIGAQSKSSVAVSGTVAEVDITLTFTNNGEGGPLYTSRQGTAKVNTHVIIDNANDGDSRSATTCY